MGLKRTFRFVTRTNDSDREEERTLRGRSEEATGLNDLWGFAAGYRRIKKKNESGIITRVYDDRTVVEKREGTSPMPLSVVGELHKVTIDYQLHGDDGEYDIISPIRENTDSTIFNGIPRWHKERGLSNYS